VNANRAGRDSDLLVGTSPGNILLEIFTYAKAVGSSKFTVNHSVFGHVSGKALAAGKRFEISRKNRRRRPRVERLEQRWVLAAELGIGPPIFPPGPPAHVELPEVARRPEHRLPPAWIAELPLERFSGGFELAEPLIVVGDPNGTPSVTPDSRIDPNLPDSAFAGVVSINPNNATHDSRLCTGSVINAFAYPDRCPLR